MFRFIYEDIDFSHKLNSLGNPHGDYHKHLHYFNELIYFVSGKVKYTVESETKTLSPGDVVIIRSGQYHFAEVDESAPYERYVLKFPETFLPDVLKEKFQNAESFAPKNNRFEWVFRQLDAYYGEFTEAETKELFRAELIKILIFLTKQSNKEEKQESDLISKIIYYVNAHIKEPITLDTLNKEFNFSKSYISNEFRKNMKIPVMQYVRAKKIIAAHQQILKGAKRTLVAEEYGFENYSTFYRSYLSVMGFPPSGNGGKKE